MSGDVAIEAPGATGEPAAAPASAEVALAPLVRVERGDPTPEQLAALTVVLSALGRSPEPARAPRTLWSQRSRFARPRPAIGPGGWRASALPR